MKKLLLSLFPSRLNSCRKTVLLTAISSILLCGKALSQTPEDSLLSIHALKKMSLEELMNIEVTSVSKRPEKLKEAASAIQVITHDEIISSGAKTLPEALKLAGNLQVAKVNSNQWAISSRGFNNVLANKLLVLIDGRTVYTPLYAGVFWDVQNLLLEDVDRIEVISGPGGTLWGANAVNGVINIITKNAKDTKGLYAEGAIGNTMPGLGSIRYGGEIRKNLFFRLYGTGFKMGNTLDTNGLSAKDHWSMSQGGARLDWDATENDKFSLQGNLYYGRPNPEGAKTPVIASGDNIVALWNHKFSESSDLQFQGYYDHTWRDFMNGLTEDAKTYDFELQHKFELGKRHNVTYGVGYRQIEHSVTNPPLLGFYPANKTLQLYSAFLQYEAMIVKNYLRFTIGSKLEHNSYTAFQYQPNARLTFTPTKDQTIWAAASRAVRNPARLDREFRVEFSPGVPAILGSDTFQSETVIAYELGWRMQPVQKLSTSLSGFYNVYDNIRSVEPSPTPSSYPIIIGNGVQGESYGCELSLTSKVATWWQLRGSYTIFAKDLKVKPGSKDLNNASAESNDPKNQFLIQSTIDLPYNISFGTFFRYVDELPKPIVPHYFGLDLRLSWKVHEMLEVSVVGQNLLYDTHKEFIASSRPREIERSVYGKIICRF